MITQVHKGCRETEMVLVELGIYAWNFNFN